VILPERRIDLSCLEKTLDMPCRVFHDGNVGGAGIYEIRMEVISHLCRKKERREESITSLRHAFRLSQCLWLQREHVCRSGT
jgi:hypothetical protein